MLLKLSICRYQKNYIHNEEKQQFIILKTLLILLILNLILKQIKALKIRNKISLVSRKCKKIIAKKRFIDYNNIAMKSKNTFCAHLADRKVKHIHFVQLCEPEAEQVGSLVIVATSSGYYEGIRIIEDEVSFISQFHGQVDSPITSIFHALISYQSKVLIGCANGDIYKVYKDRKDIYKQKIRLRPEILSLYPNASSIIAWNLNSEALIINQNTMTCQRRIPFGIDINCIMGLEFQKQHLACIAFKDRETPLILGSQCFELSNLRIDNLRQKAQQENSQMNLQIYLMSKNKGLNEIAACLNQKNQKKFYLGIYHIQNEDSMLFCSLYMRFQLHSEPLYIQIYKNKVITQEKRKEQMLSQIIDVKKRQNVVSIKERNGVEIVIKILRIEDSNFNEQKYLLLCIPVIGFIQTDLSKVKPNKIQVKQVIRAKNRDLQAN